MDLLSEGACCLLHVVQLGIERRPGWIEQHGDERGGRNDLAQQPEPLRAENVNQQGDSSDITTGPVVARHQTQFDGILAASENDRDGCRGRLRRQRGRGATGTNHCDPSAYKLACESRQSIHLTFRPAVFDADIAVLDVTGLTQALVECGHGTRPRGGRCAVEKTDHRHRRLLRARRERPRRRRAAEEADELAPPYAEHGDSLPCHDAGFTARSACHGPAGKSLG